MTEQDAGTLLALLALLVDTYGGEIAEKDVAAALALKAAQEAEVVLHRLIRELMEPSYNGAKI